jgi:gamma-glutamyl phosphate reductase
MKGPILDAMKSAKVALDIAKVSVTDAKEALEHIDEINSGHSNSGSSQQPKGL